MVTITRHVFDALGHEKEKRNFTGGRTCQVGSVGWAFSFFFLSFFVVAKMTTLKTQKFREKNQTFSAEKFGENISTYFQKISARIFRFWSKNGWFYKILEKFIKKKILPKQKIWVSRARQTGFFFFSWPYGMFIHLQRYKSRLKVPLLSLHSQTWTIWKRNYSEGSTK